MAEDKENNLDADDQDVLDAGHIALGDAYAEHLPRELALMPDVQWQLRDVGFTRVLIDGWYLYL